MSRREQWQEEELQEQSDAPESVDDDDQVMMVRCSAWGLGTVPWSGGTCDDTILVANTVNRVHVVFPSG
jgi:hypothetical protein